MILLLLSAITTNTLRVPRCVAGQEVNNRTIHLVHPYEIDKWQQTEFDIISKVIKNYKDFKIHLILINMEPKEPVKIILKYEQQIINKTETRHEIETTTGNIITTKDKLTSIKNNEKLGKRKRRKVADYNINIKMEAQKLLDFLLNGKVTETNTIPKDTNTIPAKTITTTTTTTNRRNEQTSIASKGNISNLIDLLREYPDITVENTTYNQIFFNSPLYPYWPDMTETFRIFAIRVLALWQHGGISFDLQPTITTTQYYSRKNSSNTTQSHIDQIYNMKVMKFIVTEKKKFDSLPENVIAADDEGLHMESKVPCHAFFGELLMNLRNSRNYSSIQDIIKRTVSVFCKHYAAEKKYCDKLEFDK